MTMRIARTIEATDRTAEAVCCQADFINALNRKTYGKQKKEVSWRLLVQFLGRPNNKQIRLSRKYRNFIRHPIKPIGL